MAYEKQEWINSPTQTTPINADRLNHIEEGIYEASQSAGVVETTQAEYEAMKTAGTLEDKYYIYETSNDYILNADEVGYGDSNVNTAINAINSNLAALKKIDCGEILSISVNSNSYTDVQITFKSNYFNDAPIVNYSLVSGIDNPDNVSAWNSVTALRLPNFNKNGGSIRIFNASEYTISVHLDWNAIGN